MLTSWNKHVNNSEHACSWLHQFFNWSCWIQAHLRLSLETVTTQGFLYLQLHVATKLFPQIRNAVFFSKSVEFQTFRFTCIYIQYVADISCRISCSIAFYLPCTISPSTLADNIYIYTFENLTSLENIIQKLINNSWR